MTFRLACIPPTANHHAKKIVRVGQWSRLADKPELVAAREMLDGLLLHHQPAEPVRGPVALEVEFTWPWRKGDSQRLRSRGRVPHTSKPDLSNAIKNLEDRLVALRFIDDDRSVVRLALTKFWGNEPGIVVRIEPATEGLLR